MQLVHDVRRVWDMPEQELAALADDLIKEGRTDTPLYEEVKKRIAQELIPKSAAAMRAAFGMGRPKAGARSKP